VAAVVVVSGTEAGSAGETRSGNRSGWAPWEAGISQAGRAVSLGRVGWVAVAPNCWMPPQTAWST